MVATKELDLDRIVGDMRRLGVRRLRTPDLELELDRPAAVASGLEPKRELTEDEKREKVRSESERKRDVLLYSAGGS